MEYGTWKMAQNFGSIAFPSQANANKTVRLFGKTEITIYLHQQV